MSSQTKSEQWHRERECVHRAQGAEGDFYDGMTYVRSLQRAGSGVAMDMARKVTSFFWSDAPQIVVWLCRDCASALRLNDEVHARRRS